MTLLALSCNFSSLRAQGDAMESLDSLRTIDLEGFEVQAYSLQSSRPVELQPLSATRLNTQALDRYAITDLTRLTSRIPSLYIPDYGSRQSSAIYLRGVGARSSGQTIGFYIDGVPYLSKSSFNFDLVGISSIEVLRGPQGTLYGRNAMAGIINLYTKSAFTDPGLSVDLGYGNYDHLRLKAEYHKRLSEQWGISIGGSLAQRDGYRYNVVRQAAQDSMRSASALLKLEYRPSQQLRSSLSASYEQIEQGAFPYQRLDRKSGALLPLDNNEAALYRRRSLSLRWRTILNGDWWQLESATGYQHLSDRMGIDMDASRLPAFFLDQRVRQHALTQEIVLKNKSEDDRVHWSWGLFAYYDHNRLSSPVTLRPAGISSLVQRGLDMMSKSNPKAPKIEVDASKEVLNANEFIKPDMGAALYYEGMVRDFFVAGLDLTAGVRFDYSHQAIDYDSRLSLRLRPILPAPAPQLPWMQHPTRLSGLAKQGSWQVLPKVALQYDLGRGKLFASMSKGFKSGGYNEQTLTEIIRKVNVLETFKMGKPMSEAELNKSLAFAPEIAWNYELGLKLRSLAFVDRMHLSVYYTDVQNLQLTHFVSSGAGRMISNVGRSYSLGFEASAALSLWGDPSTQRDHLGLNLNYGFTHARLRGSERESRVPFIPEHTYSAMLVANKALGHRMRLFSEVELSGLANIYWTEDNTTREPAYGLLSARLGYSYGPVTLSLWGRNLLDKEYRAFYALSMGSSMMQLGSPRTLGVELGLKL